MVKNPLILASCISGIHVITLYIINLHIGIFSGAGSLNKEHSGEKSKVEAET